MRFLIVQRFLTIKIDDIFEQLILQIQNVFTLAIVVDKMHDISKLPYDRGKRIKYRNHKVLMAFKTICTINCNSSFHIFEFLNHDTCN